MMPTRPLRVLVTGATGFIGGRLCEVMALTGAYETRAFVHSTASAWRITRLPIEFWVGDLTDRQTVDRAVRGCDAIIHLARGGRPVMQTGLENLLRAARVHGIRRFVHVSSVAVYGDDPAPESVSEDAPARPNGSAYGREKLEQERRVLRSHHRFGLPTVILRPPNVYGPFSWFTLNVLNKVRAGMLPIVDGGRNPCNLVGVDNLVYAMFLALDRADAVGETFFITDGQPVTWERCLTDHGRLLGVSVPRVSSADLLPPQPAERPVRDSLKALVRVLPAGEFRSVLRQIPIFRLAESRLYEWFEGLPEATRDRLRAAVTAAPAVQASERRFSAADGLVASQRRTVAHSVEKAHRLLGYTPPVSYDEGMAVAAAWLRFARAIPEPSADAAVEPVPVISFQSKAR